MIDRNGVQPVRNLQCDVFHSFSSAEKTRRKSRDD